MKTIFNPLMFDVTQIIEANERLIETNKRLHRRCQKLESQVIKWRRRYAAVFKPAQELLKVARGHLELAQIHHDNAWKDWKEAYDMKRKWWKLW